MDVQGVAETIARYFELQGMSQEEAKSKFWLVDSRVSFRTLLGFTELYQRAAADGANELQGLVAHNRGDNLPEHKRYLARSEPDAPKLRTLQEVVEHVQPTALMGLSTLGGAFTKESESPVPSLASSCGMQRRLRY